MYEDKTRKFSKELKKLQELNLQSEEELQKYEIKFQELQSDLLNCQDRNRQGLSELTAKEEELVVHKVELSSLHEKFRAKVDEVRIVILVCEVYEFECCFIQKFSHD